MRSQLLNFSQIEGEPFHGRRKGSRAFKCSAHIITSRRSCLIYFSMKVYIKTFSRWLTTRQEVMWEIKPQQTLQAFLRVWRRIHSKRVWEAQGRRSMRSLGPKPRYGEAAGRTDEVSGGNSNCRWAIAMVYGVYGVWDLWHLWGVWTRSKCMSKGDGS